MEPLTKKETPTSIIFILIFVLLAAGILIGGYFAYRNYEQNYRREVEHLLSTVAELKVNQLVQWRKERLGDANLFYQNDFFSEHVKHYFKNLNNAEAKKRIQNWMDQIASAYSYNRLCLHDAKGIERISVPETKIHQPSIFSERSAEALKSCSVIFQDFYRDENDQQVYLNFFIPVLDETDNSKALGVISMRIDPAAYLYPLIQKWPTPSRTSETLIIRRDGNDALFLNDLRFRKDAALNLRIPLTSKDVLAVKAALGIEGIVEGIDYRGASVIGDVRAVPDSPWFIVARMDIEEVNAPLRERAWLMILLAGTLLLGSGAGVGLVWRQQRLRFYREQYNSAKALRESEAFTKMVMDNLPIGLAVNSVDPAVKFQYMNDNFPRFYRTTREALAATDMFWEAVYEDPEFRETIKKRVLEDIASGDPAQMFWEDVPITRNGEETTYVTARNTPIPEKSLMISAVWDVTERKRAEETLKVSESRYRRLFEAARDGILILDAETGMIVDVNPFLVEMLGYSRKQFLGKKIWELGFFKDIANNKLNFTKLQQKEFIQYENLPLETSEGRLINVEFVSHVYQVDRHKVMQCNIRDITERKQAEEALRESEQKFRETVVNLDEGYYSVTSDGVLLEHNQAFCRILGFDKSEDLKGTKLPDFWQNPDERNVYLQEFADKGSISNYPINAKTKTGDKITVLASAHLIKDKDNRPLRIEGVFLDITERIRAEEALRESEKRLREAQEMAHLGFWNWDVKTGEVEWSEEVFKIFCLDPEEFTPHIDSILALSPWPEDHQRGQELIQRAIETRSPGSYEQKFLRPDQSIGHYYSTFQGNYDEKGDLTSIVGTVLDITQRKRVEEEIRKLNAELEDRVVKRTAQLEAANKELEAFSYSVSHDLRAPLRHVSGYVELLGSRFQTDLPEKGKHYLDMITDSVRQMGILIDDLLQFSRTGRTEMHGSDLDMKRIVKEVSEQMSKDNPERNMEWIIAQLPSVHGDAAMLHLVWMNLLSNAVKFTRKKKKARIEIGFREEEKEFVFFVRDNGVGFDMQYAQKLFGVFQRLHPAADFEGTGIGLANVHRIVSRHSGRTWTEAEINKGATFYFSLPK